jgi:nucleotide-binding universal stress UspA family protein
VVDDRLPGTGWFGTGRSTAILTLWEQAVEDEVEALKTAAESAMRGLGLEAQVEVERGRPADSLLSLSEQVDLLLIGSRRWGPLNRLLLGTTGEALMHDAACPLLAVPRPAA